MRGGKLNLDEGDIGLEILLIGIPIFDKLAKQALLVKASYQRGPNSKGLNSVKLK